VDVPSFDSLEEFLRVLARFEPSDRRAALRLLLERYVSAGGIGSSVTEIDTKPKPGVPPTVTVHAGPPPLGFVRRTAATPRERRRAGAHVSALRRDLREADRQLFAQHVARRTTATIVKMPIRANTATEATDTPQQKVPDAMPSENTIERSTERGDPRPRRRRSAIAIGAAALLLPAAALFYLRHVPTPSVS